MEYFHSILTESLPVKSSLSLILLMQSSEWCKKQYETVPMESNGTLFIFLEDLDFADFGSSIV